MSTFLLDAQNLGISFGGLKAVQALTLQIPPNALHGLIGPNGAGKTTAFNLLTGVYKPQTGSMTLNAQNLMGLPPHLIAKAGLSRTFQNIRLFGELSVLDNVMLASHCRGHHSIVATLFRSPTFLAQEQAMRRRAMHLLDLFALAPAAHAQAKSLPYGDQRRLEICRALATEPRVLLLDEPAAGLNPSEKQALAKLIQTVKAQFNLAVLLIEHDMSLVMQVCEQITVLDHGCTIAHGTPSQIQSDPRVREAYLGEPTPTPAGT
ncbi:MAG: ABC transporter ATP-binding protein [Phycisphaeraceae bacterium]|jgi:branched-chain amino acid transport system ATP-binding protein|nr:ABC transporter ATP-binding protein [Phycisphaeraceae bacterium]